jgi:hypothetical protein
MVKCLVDGKRCRIKYCHETGVEVSCRHYYLQYYLGSCPEVWMMEEATQKFGRILTDEELQQYFNENKKEFINRINRTYEELLSGMS